MTGSSLILPSATHKSTSISPAISSPHSLLRSSNVRPQRLIFSIFPNSLRLARSSSRNGRALARAAAEEVAAPSPAKELRKILESPGIHQGPACFDALSAKLVERAGFKYCFMSGFSVSAARLALPDVGLISYGEMVDQGSQITQAVSIPVIGDGDNGYGNSMNVKRTVKGYIKAGFAGIILEDQVSPKACGHTRGRKVVSREDAVMRIKAAIDARKESRSDIVIIARTDSRQAISLEESLWRSRAFADAGADVLFIDALASREEMKSFSAISPLLPKMANMLEGGGKTPILNPMELEEMGYKLVSYPLSLIGVSIRAMEDALAAIKGGRMPPPGSLPSFEEVKEKIGFNNYYEEEARYSVVASQSPLYERGYTPSTDAYNTKSTIESDINQVSERLSEPVVEVVTPYAYDEDSFDDSKGRLPGMWSRNLRLKITGGDGLEKLDVRIPAGFLEGFSRIVPGLAGVDIIELLNNASQESGDPPRGKVLLDFRDRAGDRIQVFFE